MKLRTWILFACTQATATTAIASHFVPDRVAVLGYLLLLPGLAAVFGVVGNNFQGPKWDAVFILLAIGVNAAVWQGIALGIRRIKNRNKNSN